MENAPINNVLQHLLSELDRQSRVLCEMHNLINQKSVRLECDQTYYFKKAHSEKRRLLELIKNHSEKLRDLKETWCNFGVQISVETEVMIQTKIDEIASTAQNILNIEENHGLRL